MRQPRILTSALLALLTFAPLAAQADSDETIAASGVNRTYVLHVPAHVASPARLILAFHGQGMSGATEARYTGLDALSDRFGFVVAYPDGLNQGWNDGIPGGNNTADDVGFARALVAHLSAQYHVTSEHVFATGMSNGAIFLYRLACDRSSPMAAIAPVAGTMPANVLTGCEAIHNISVLEIAGTADPIVPFNGGPLTAGGTKRGNLVSFDISLGYWAGNSYCDMRAIVTTLPPIAPPDGTRVKRYVYRACASGTAFVGYAIVGGGHALPGGGQYAPKSVIGTASNQLQASLEIVKFFMALAP